MGNKGGIGVSFNLGGSKVCFVTAHLPAHQNKVLRRAATTQRPSRRRRAFLRAGAGVVLTIPSTPRRRMLKGETAQVAERHAAAKKIDGELARALAPDGAGASLAERFDAVVWSGDLNYRTDVDRAAADAFIDAGDLAGLAAADQLGKARASGDAFAAYAEAPLSFPPTRAARVQEGVFSRRRPGGAFCDGSRVFAANGGFATMPRGVCATARAARLP